MMGRRALSRSGTPVRTRAVANTPMPNTRRWASSTSSSENTSSLQASATCSQTSPGSIRPPGCDITWIAPKRYFGPGRTTSSSAAWYLPRSTLAWPSMSTSA